MNRFDQTEITPSEEGALVMIADACGLNAPAPANVWELILKCIRETPQMRLSSLTFALAKFASDKPQDCQGITIGEIHDRCRVILGESALFLKAKRTIQRIDDEFRSLN